MICCANQSRPTPWGLTDWLLPGFELELGLGLGLEFRFAFAVSVGLLSNESSFPRTINTGTCFFRDGETTCHKASESNCAESALGASMAFAATPASIKAFRVPGPVAQNLGPACIGRCAKNIRTAWALTNITACQRGHCCHARSTACVSDAGPISINGR